MIFTDRTITVRKGESRIDEPIVVYRGDYELEVRFTILNSRFKFMSGTNMIESEKASYGQLAILTPYGGNIFSDIVRCNDGSVTFVLTAEMLNQIEEVGLYSFQIRLMDYNKESRVSIPPIEFGIEVREPIASEDHDNSVNNAIVGYSIAKVVDPKEENVGDTFNESGNYNKTKWETGDRISEGKLNKIEDAIDKINENEVNNTAVLSKRIDNNFSVLDSKIEMKADNSDVVIKGLGTLSDFDEQTRRAIMGMGSTNINAVLGEGNVTRYNLANDSVTPEKCSFLSVGKSSAFFIDDCESGGLSSAGLDTDDTGYIRTGYVNISNSHEVIIDEISGKYANKAGYLYGFGYYDIGGKGYFIEDYCEVTAYGSTGFKFNNTEGYKYFRMNVASPTYGDIRNTLNIYIDNGRINASILSNYDLDKRYEKQGLIELLVDYDEKNIYDGTYVPGGLTTDGLDINDDTRCRTNFVPLNNGSVCAGVYVTITDNSRRLNASLGATPYLFLYETADTGAHGYKINTFDTDLDSNSWTFYLGSNSSFRYLRMNVASPAYVNIYGSLSITVNNKPIEMSYNNISLNRLYITEKSLNDKIRVDDGIYEIYDKSCIEGGLSHRGTDATVDGYARTSFLRISNEDDTVGTILSINDGTGELIKNNIIPFVFLYKEDFSTAYKVENFIIDADKNTYTFDVPDNYMYLRTNVKSPSYGDLTQTLSIVNITKSKPAEFIINNVSLVDHFVLKSELENEVFDIVDDMDLNGGSEGGISNKAPRPSNGVVNFQVTLNTNLTHEGDSLNIIDNDTQMVDDCMLLLPSCYDPSGTPTRLIISCHGAGTTITSSSSSLAMPGDYFVNCLGYAVLDVNGAPKSLTGNSGLHYGSPLALQSYIKAYNYVIEKYNIRADGCFVYGTSMGGLTSFMLCQSGALPVLAQAGFCPVTDHFRQAYCNPWNSPSSQRSQIAKLFGFTGTTPTWTNSKYPSESEIQYYMDNIDKVTGYNPMMKHTMNWRLTDPYSAPYGSSEEGAKYSELIKYHPVPLKIWHNDDDGTVLQRYSEYLVTSIRNSGGLAYLRKFPSGGHNAWDNGNTINVLTFDGKSYTVRASGYEAGLWFKRFDK